MKKILNLVLIVLITTGLVYALVHYTKIESFSFAFALNFLLMACTLTFTETLKSPLNSTYFTEKSWEAGGKIYGSLGIHFFKKFLVLTGWEKLNKKTKPVEKNTKALLNLHYRTKQDELGHLIIMFIVLGFTVFVAFKFGVLKSLSLLILNISLNIYPVFLQRYNRPRIERIINLSNRR